MSDFPNGLSQLDAQQVIRKQNRVNSDGSFSQSITTDSGNLVTEQYDEIDLTYVPAGPGAGEIQTVTYKFQGSTIAILTMTYDGSNRLSTVVRS